MRIDPKFKTLTLQLIHNLSIIIRNSVMLENKNKAMVLTIDFLRDLPEV